MTRTILVLALLLTGCQCNGVTPTPTASSTPAVTATPTKPPTATPKPTETAKPTPTVTPTPDMDRLAAVETRVEVQEAAWQALLDSLWEENEPQLRIARAPDMVGRCTWYAPTGDLTANGTEYITGNEPICAVDYSERHKYMGAELLVCSEERCIRCTVCDTGYLYEKGGWWTWEPRYLGKLAMWKWHKAPEGVGYQIVVDLSRGLYQQLWPEGAVTVWMVG